MNRKIILFFALAFFFLCGLSGVGSVQVGWLSPIYAQEHKQLSKTLMAMGQDLTDEQIEYTKRLLGDTAFATSDILKIDSDLVVKYTSSENRESKILSSVSIKPMEKGYGIVINIVTPTRIKKVSPETYQNAVITSGVTDAIIRVAAVEEVTGHGALAGIYALLEQSGQELSEEEVKLGQEELTLVEELTTETSLSDQEVNRILGELKRDVTQKNVAQEEVSEAWLLEQVETIFSRSQVSLSGNSLEKVIGWLRRFSQSETAQKDETVEQLETSFLTTDWWDTLLAQEEVLSASEILKLDQEDYSDSSTYHPIVQELYQHLLQSIKSGKLNAVKTIYNHSFIIEKMLGQVSVKEKQALNYVRLLCYYFIADKEDGKLQKALEKSTAPVWLRQASTKENLLYALKSYHLLGQLPELQEIINRIALRTGYAYEAFLYENISQKGDIISLDLVCPCLDNQEKLSATYNLKTDAVQLIKGQKRELLSDFDFSTIYGLTLTNDYQALVDDVSQYRILEQDKSIFSITAQNKQAHLSYKLVLEDYATVAKADSFTLNEDFNQSLPYINEDYQVVKKVFDQKDFYYSLVDLNHDGIDELIVTDRDDRLILGLYGFDGSKAQFIAGSYTHSEMLIFEDGTINYSGDYDEQNRTTWLSKVDRTGIGLESFIKINRQATGHNQFRFDVEDGNGQLTSYSSATAFVKDYSAVVGYLTLGRYSLLNLEQQENILDMAKFKSLSNFDATAEFLTDDTLDLASESFFDRLWSRLKDWLGLQPSEELSSVPIIDSEEPLTEVSYTVSAMTFAGNSILDEDGKLRTTTISGQLGDAIDLSTLADFFNPEDKEIFRYTLTSDYDPLTYLQSDVYKEEIFKVDKTTSKRNKLIIVYNSPAAEQFRPANQEISKAEILSYLLEKGGRLQQDDLVIPWGNFGYWSDEFDLSGYYDSAAKELLSELNLTHQEVEAFLKAEKRSLNDLPLSVYLDSYSRLTNEQSDIENEIDQLLIGLFLNKIDEFEHSIRYWAEQRDFSKIESQEIENLDDYMSAVQPHISAYVEEQGNGWEIDSQVVSVVLSESYGYFDDRFSRDNFTFKDELIRLLLRLFVGHLDSPKSPIRLWLNRYDLSEIDEEAINSVDEYIGVVEPYVRDYLMTYDDYRAESIENQEESQIQGLPVQSWFGRFLKELKLLFTPLSATMVLEDIAQGDYSSVVGTWRTESGNILSIGENGLLPDPYQIRAYPNQANQLQNSDFSVRGGYWENYRLEEDWSDLRSHTNITYLPAGETIELYIREDGKDSWSTYTAEKDSILLPHYGGAIGDNVDFEQQYYVYTRTSRKVTPVEQLRNYYSYSITAGHYGGGVIADRDGRNLQVSRTLKIGEELNLASLAPDFDVLDAAIYQVTLFNENTSLSLAPYQTSFKITEETTRYPSVSITYDNQMVEKVSDHSWGLGHKLKQIVDDFWENLLGIFQFEPETRTNQSYQENHDAYQKVLNEYIDFIQSEQSLIDGYSYLNSVMQRPIDESVIYYGLIDIDQNGLDELVVADISNKEILGLYAFDGQEVLNLGGAEYRSTMFIFDDGTIYQSGSGGALFSSFSLDRLDSSGYRLNELLSFNREYLNSSLDEVVFEVSQGNSRETYYNEEDFIQAYPDFIKYWSSSPRPLLKGSEQAKPLDMSSFKHINDAKE